MTKPNRKPKMDLTTGADDEPPEAVVQRAEPQHVDIEEMLRSPKLFDETVREPDPPQLPPAEPWKPGDLLPPAEPTELEKLNARLDEPLPEGITIGPYTPLRQEIEAIEDLTIGELLGQIKVDPEDPNLPGFVMSDEPLDVPSTASGPPGAGVSAANTPEGTDAGIPDTPITPAAADILSPSAQRVAGYGAGSTVRYEGRIRVLEAFQYMGRLENAPDWIDRNWIGFADFDELRRIEAGPCLRVPLLSGAVAVCRIGDFVVQQEVVLAHGMAPDVRVEVWAQSDFVKNFIPVTA